MINDGKIIMEKRTYVLDKNFQKRSVRQFYGQEFSGQSGSLYGQEVSG